MRRTGITRFVLLGAAGFGIGGAVAGIVGAFVAIPVAGAVGGASLGLALGSGEDSWPWRCWASRERSSGF